MDRLSTTQKMLAVTLGAITLMGLLWNPLLWGLDSRYVRQDSIKDLNRMIACALFEEDMPNCRIEIRRQLLEQAREQR